MIGRKALRLTGNSENVVLSRKMLLSKLNDWMKNVSHLPVFPPDDKSYTSMCSMTFLYLIFHFIRLHLLKTQFLDCLAIGNVDDQAVVLSTESVLNILSPAAS